MNNESNSIIKKIPKFYLIIFSLLVLFSIYARAEGYWYSSYQGDEINTIDFKQFDGNTLEYLLSKKRGPTQYVLNLANYYVFDNLSEYFIRLPYLLFGIGAIYAIYRLGKKTFSKEVGILAAILLATNGLYIAFARITQYQALMYFLIPLQILYFIYSVKNDKSLHLLLSGLFGSIILLTHYDAGSVVPFYLTVIFAINAKDRYVNVLTSIRNNFQKLLKQLAIFFTGYFVPSMAWYIPYSMHDSFSNTTSAYLSGRLFGGGLNPRLNEKYTLLTMYMPIEYIWAIAILTLIGIAFVILESVKIDLIIDTATLKRKVKNKDFSFVLSYINPRKLLTLHHYIPFIFVGVIAIFWVYINFKPQSDTGGFILLLTSILLAAYMFFSNRYTGYKSATVIWFLGAYSFYFLIMKDPRTHVYMAFIPMFLLSGYSIINLLHYFNKLKHLILCAFLVLLLFVSLVNYRIFIDRSPEYPWTNNNQILGYNLYEIKRVSHGRIEGVFGFNNYRAFDEIGTLFERGCLVGTYQSNEKNSITKHYIGTDQVFHSDKELKIRNDEIARDVFIIDEQIDNMIWVEGPHSWNYQNINRFQEKLPLDYIPVYEYKQNDVILTKIWGKQSIYNDGTLLCNEDDK